jgi:tRNA G18 (ribose-2'-O)-methylase SpoU
VAIPTVGRVGSLTVSAAAAVLLFAVAEAHS